MRRAAAAIVALALLGGAAPAPLTLTLVLTGLRSSDGAVRLCLWADGAGFPDCGTAEPVRRLEAAAAPEVRLTVEGLPPGSYAVSAIHDENGNRKLDKSLIGMPTEGVGFSRNPRIIFGPPKFARAQFDLAAAPVQTIRMKYFL